MKCIVYNLETGSESIKEFWCAVNGVVYKGPFNEVVDLPEEAIDVLNNAVVDTMADKDGKKQRIITPRFRVVVVEPAKNAGDEMVTTTTAPKESFVCDVCGKEFQSQFALEGHKRSHK